MFVTIDYEEGFNPASPELVIDGLGLTTDQVNCFSRLYGISPGGERFIFTTAGAGAAQTEAQPDLVLIQNWSEELKPLVPTD